MAEIAMNGVPGGGLGKAVDSVVAKAGRGLDSIQTKAMLLESTFRRLTNHLTRFGNGGGVNTNSVTSMMPNSFGNVPSAPGPATGSGAQFPSFSSYAAGIGMSKGTFAAAALGGLALRGGLAGIATATAMVPGAEEGLYEQNLLHQVGMRGNGYMGRASQMRLEQAIRAANPFGYQIGGPFATRQAAAMMAGAGMPVRFGAQSTFMTNLSQGVGLSMMSGMDHATAASSQVGFYQGPTAARMTMYGMPVRDLFNGNMKNTQQVLDTMWNRMATGPGSKNGVTAREVQQSYMSGWLGADLRTLGLDANQQQMAVSYFTARARNGGPVNLSDPATLDRLGFNKKSDTMLSLAQTDEKRAQALAKSFVPLAEGVEMANNHIQALYEKTLPMFDTALGQLAIKMKAYAETIATTPEGQPGIAALGGLAMQGVNSAMMMYGLHQMKKFLGVTKGGPGGPGGPPAPGTPGTPPAPGAPKAPLPVGRTGGGLLSKILGPLGVGVTMAQSAWNVRDTLRPLMRNANAQTWSDFATDAGGQVWNGVSNLPVLNQLDALGNAVPEPIRRWLMGQAKKEFKSVVSGGDSPVPGNAVIGTPWRSKGNWGKGYHPGIDIRASTGTPVMAALDGRVIRSGSDGAWGNAVHIKQSDGTVATYAHLSKILVSKGDTVGTGALIGKAGYSGRVIPAGPGGAHLHFEVRTGLDYNSRDVNPVPYVKGRGSITSRGKSRGTGGTSGQQVVEYAKQFIGVPYVAGGRSPKGWDCAGFTWYIYRHFGKEIGQVSEEQLKRGSPVKSPAQAMPGDLFIWRRKGTKGVGADGHVGMYVGGGKVIHAHGGAGGTTNITSLAAAVPSSHYLAGIRRVVSGTVGQGAHSTGGEVGVAGATASGTPPYAPMSVSVGATGMTVTTSSIADFASGNGTPAAYTGAASAGARSTASDKGDSGRMGVGAQVGGSSNAAKVWNMLMAEGFGAAAAAGIIGNLQQESGVNPLSNQGGGGPGRGIMQWTNTERWASLKSWAHRRGVSARSLSTQVEYMLKEMRDYGVLGQMKNIDDVQKATDFFQYKMERAGEPNMPARYKYAREALKQFGRGSYSEGAYNISRDEDARVHRGEMILTSSQAEAVRKTMAETLSGIKSGNHVWNIYPPAGTTEDQIRHIVTEVQRRLGQDATTRSLMET